MGTLSPSELRKYEWRIPTFLQRLATGTFITTSNTEVKLTYNGENLEERLRNDTARAVGKLLFVADDGTPYKLSDLLKDAGFGGVGSTLKREDQALALLQQKIEIEKHNHGSDAIPIRVGSECFFVATVASTPGTPKSDFHFVDHHGQEVVWISHKHGKSPRCFQQWGGCSARHEPNIFNHPETRAFGASIRDLVFTAGTTVARSIEDDRLKHLAVYGNDFGGDLGRNNVSLVLQGLPGLAANTSNLHFEVAALHVHANGTELPREYSPTFMAMYRGDRNDFGIQNCRVGISPRNARLISSWIEHHEESGPHPSHRGSVSDEGCSGGQEPSVEHPVCNGDEEQQGSEPQV